MINIEWYVYYYDVNRKKIDTYNIFESGLPNVIKLDDELIAKYPDDPNKRVMSVRIDSGDLARGSKKLRKALDAAGKNYIKIVASNSLDENKMADMERYEGARIDSYGVGEKLITSATDPVFGGVYKLVAVKKEDGTYEPKMKCSDSVSKAIIPGKLMAWRVFDSEGKGQCDIISLDNEEFKDGDIVDLINDCNEKIPNNYYRPYQFEFVDALPKTPLGKVDFLKLEKDAVKDADITYRKVSTDSMDLEILNREFIVIDGEEYPCCVKGSADGDYWYK